MIVDGHAYCFEPADAPAGHASGAEHLSWLQLWYAKHHQPALRLRDRAPGDAAVLNPSGAWDPTGLPDLEFRADRAAGRMLWEHGSDTYTKYSFPPNLRNLEFTPESLISEMDYAGVDIALLHTDPMLGRGSEFQAECVRRYPDRLRSMAPVEEWRLPEETDAVIAELETSIHSYGLHAIKIIPPHFDVRTDLPWDDAVYHPFWDAATALGVPLFFTMGTGPAALRGPVSTEKQREGYLAELKILARWMERYPDVRCGLTHGFPWRLYLEKKRIALPAAIWEVFRNPHCHLEVCFPVRLGDLFDFPYREVMPTLQEMVERIGAARLFWGTDMPLQNRFCTYRQSRIYIEKYCTFLSRDDLDLIMGGTAARLLDPPEA